MPRILAEGFPELERPRPRLDVGQAADAALGLGDDLVGHDEHVAGLERLSLPGECAGDQLGQVVARPDLGQALHCDRGYGPGHGAFATQDRARISWFSIPRVWAAPPWVLSS